ncbi:N-acyl-D-amino-acid deacylase family protein [Thalassotalea atypica]|uniref:N-acyl-D-amino-acid deacylase family protein n=1 Tax=Thalassotalea atypica TaxID=2054316 RepID=UPI00257271A2|nr:amidohydrolase family protein [Thalassotalea atypica]
MKKRIPLSLSLVTTIAALAVSACTPSADNATKMTVENKTDKKVDILITGGRVFTELENRLESIDVAICGEKICDIFPTGSKTLNAKQTIDAKGNIVSPGFIDPHTHTMEELLSSDKNHNLNYLTQGVTTVVNGNDGEGPVDIGHTARVLESNGIGTNVALLTGHGSIREQVMGREQRHASQDELLQMEALVKKAMEQGALGLSSGLYYVPGSYATTEEVIRLAKVASQYKGIYDTHLRDESTFNIGFISALKEAINIAKNADIHLHLAHIKALGVDVWGQSKQAIELINNEKKSGMSISADQYPWLASGTKLHSAIMPKWAMADSKQAFYERLNDPALSDQLQQEIAENIRRRGGPTSLVITAFKDTTLIGKNLQDLAEEMNMSPVDTAKVLVQQGDVRIASFNMNGEDVERFMVQPWVVTSSDGTNGHPRKYASFPQKFKKYVVDKKLLSINQFIYNSATKTADILGLKARGKIAVDYQADITIFDPQSFVANANFSKWDNYSTGVSHVVVNGIVVIEHGKYQDKLVGKFVH